jgi:hypothetical protein
VGRRIIYQMELKVHFHPAQSICRIFTARPELPPIIHLLTLSLLVVAAAVALAAAAAQVDI